MNSVVSGPQNDLDSAVLADFVIQVENNPTSSTDVLLEIQPPSSAHPACPQQRVPTHAVDHVRASYPLNASDRSNTSETSGSQ